MGSEPANIHVRVVTVEKTVSCHLALGQEVGLKPRTYLSNKSLICNHLAPADKASTTIMLQLIYDFSNGHKP